MSADGDSRKASYGSRLPLNQRHDVELWADVQHWLRYHGDYTMTIDPWASYGTYLFKVELGSNLLYSDIGKNLTARLRNVLKWLYKHDPSFEERPARGPSGDIPAVQRAKEILMQRHNLDEPTAHKFVREYSMRERITIERAAELIETTLQDLEG